MSPLPLHEACAVGNVQAVRKLLEDGAEASKVCPELGTAVHACVTSKHLDCLRAVLEDKSCDVDKPAKGVSPLCLSSGFADPECTRILIGAGADVNRVSLDPAAANEEFTVTPLYVAVLTRSTEVVKLLMSSGARPDGKKLGPDQVTYLRAAIATGVVDIVKSLLDAGAAVDEADGQGRTPLFYSVAGLGDEWDDGDVELTEEIVSLLLGKGANVNFVHKNGNLSCLHIAVSAGHHTLVKQLIDAGADVEVRDIDGATPLMHAAAEGLPEVVRVVIDAGATIDATDNEAQSALLFAVNGAGSDEDEGDGEGGAGEEGAGGASSGPKAPQQSGWVRMPTVDGEEEEEEPESEEDRSLRCRREIAAILIAKGANPNLPDEDGCTPISAADGDADWLSILQPSKKQRLG